ncbi:MAG: hypothetical protein ACLUEQ_06300 [Cloacibacillus evryensis]
MTTTHKGAAAAKPPYPFVFIWTLSGYDNCRQSFRNFQKASRVTGSSEPQRAEEHIEDYRLCREKLAPTENRLKYSFELLIIIQLEHCYADYTPN